MQLIVPDSMNGQRLDQALAELSGLTRTRIKQLIEEGAIDGLASRKLSSPVREGESFTLNLPETRALGLQPEGIDLDILFEDEHLIVVNKPAGMVVHPANGHDRGTLVHALLHHCQSLPGINGIERPGIVHRLDKDTSGSIVVAKTEQAHHGLVALFSTHDIDRQYVCWTRGVPGWRSKRIELPIARHPKHRQRMAVVEGGKEAISDAQVEQIFGDAFCRLRMTLHTGRTHQIRVHLSHERLPLLGDLTYARSFNPGRDIPALAAEAVRKLPRQALHAEVLAFTHPVTGELIDIRAPWPQDLCDLDAALIRAYSV